MKKIPLSAIRNVIIGMLILILGGMIGYRFATTRQLPLGLHKLPYVSSAVSNISNAQAASSLANLSGDPNPPEDIDVDFDTFWEVWAHLERDYVDQEKLEPSKMVDGAISGMTASLDDPYTMYLPLKDNERSGDDLAGSFYGVGIELGYIDGVLAVVSPLEGTPADLAGVEAQDLILHIKDDAKGLDEDTTDWSLNEAVEKIRGPKNAPVILTLFRKDEDSEASPEPFDVEIKRGEIVVESVVLDFVEHNDKRVAHLKVLRFGERTRGEWDAAVKEILAQKDDIDGIVLDMRNNPGGFFDTSIELASDFIKKGTIVSQKGKYTSKPFSSTGTARLEGIPLVVLVNRGSASASEIVAGAIRDNVGSKLVGEKTFGKGTVQDRRELSNGAGLHVTIGKWLLPKGAWIHEEGIPVDVEVEANRDTEEDEVLLKGIEEL